MSRSDLCPSRLGSNRARVEVRRPFESIYRLVGGFGPFIHYSRVTSHISSRLLLSRSFSRRATCPRTYLSTVCISRKKAQ
jgi:hypothetical protein